MFAGDVRVHVLHVHAGLLRDQEAQTSGIKVRAGTEHLVGRQAGQLHGHVGDDIHRVRDEHINRVRGDLHHVRDDGLHDVDGRACKIEAGLARLLASARGDDDHVGVTADLNIVGTVDGDGRIEAGAVLHVEHLGLDTLLGDVLENDFARNATLGGREGKR